VTVDEGIRGYRIACETGQLTALPGSPFLGPLRATSLSVAAGSALLAAGSADTGTINIFGIDKANGALTRAPGSPFFTGSGSYGPVAFHPTASFLYIGGGALSAFAQYASGTVDAVAGSPFDIPLPEPNWAGSPTVSVLKFHPLGTYLYAVGFFLGTQVYAVNPSNGALSKVSLELSSPESNLGDIAVHPSGRFLYVIDAGPLTAEPPPPRLRGFSLRDDGTLGPELDGSPFAVGDSERYLNFDPDGKFAFLIETSFRRKLSSFSVDASTGALKLLSTVPLPGDTITPPAFSASGKLVYLANYTDHSVCGFTVDPVTGTLSAVPGLPLAVGEEVFAIAVVSVPP
jgi:6-phosphogluconolactonase (cycloisomerase 2 family)